MAGVQPTKFINYISEFKKLLVTRQNGIISQKFKIDSATDDNYYFSIVNSNNRLIDLTDRTFKIYGSIFDSKDQMHILFYSDKCTIEQNGQQMHFKIDTYTSQYMNIVKTNKIIDLTIVEIVNPDDNIPDEEQITQVILRDTAIAYKRPYIENQTPAEILQKVILTTNVPLTGVFGSGQDINLTIGSNGAAFGTGLTQTGDNQLVIGQYNEADATKAFIIGNGENDTVRSNLFTIDYEGNIQTPGAISANAITVNGQDVGDKVNQLENSIEAVSAAIPSVEGFATEQWVQDQGYLTAHQDLTAYATKDWVEGKGYITGVNLDPYATKDQLTAYATKSDLTVSASVLNNQISQLALDIPTKVSDLTNDAGYLTAVPTSYALKTDIPTGNAQLQNTAGYITGYNAGTGISISNGTISLTGEVGKTYYADDNTLQLNNSTNTFSIKSLSSKLNQGTNIILTPQSDGSVTINAIGGGGGGTGGATYLAGLGLSLSTVSAEDGIYKFYVNESWLDNKIDTATSGIQNLSAGTGLKIEDNVISLTAQIPSIDGLASEQWVEANFLSAIPSNYATKDYVDSSVSGKADLSSVYTKEEVYTYIETDAKINQATSGKADKSEVQAVDNKFANYYTSAQVDQAIADAVDDIPSTVYTGEDGIKVENGVISLTATIPTSISDLTNDSEFATSAQVSSIVEGYGYITDAALADYAQLSDIPTGNAQLQNTAQYITSADIPTSYVQQSELESVSGQLTNAIGAKANTTQVEAEFTATSAWANETFLTEHQSLDNYYTKSEVDSAIGTATNDMATQSWVEEQGYLTAHQSLDDYYNKTQVDTALALKADSADVYTKTEVNTISSNIVNQIPTDVATSAYVQAASGNAVSVATGWVDDKNYLSSINVIQQDTEFDENTSKLFFNTGFSLAQTEDMVRIDVDTDSIATQEYVTDQVSGKADQSTVEGLSTALSTAIDTKANSADVYTKSQVYTKGETDSAITTATSGKVNKTDFDTVTGALSTAIDSKTTSGEVKTQIEAYGYQNATDVANAISGKADKSELQSVSGTLNTAIGGVSDRVGAIEADYISAITVVNEYQQFEENTKKLTFDTGFGLTQSEDTVRIELDTNYVATVDALSSVSGTLTGQISAVDTKADTNTNSINALTGRVKAIEDDYATSAYVTGQVNNLATGAVATNTANIGQLSTKLDTVSSSVPTSVYQIATAGSGITISEQGEIALIWNTIPSAVSQLINDVGFVTEAGGGGTGIEYYGGYGISVNGAEISLTADIPTNTNQLTNGAGFISAIALWFDGESDAQNVTDITFTSDFTWNSGDIGINAQGIIAANEIATESYVDGQVSGKADQSTVETLSTALSAAITGVANNIPLSTSQLTNDSGFITASDIPAAPSTVYDKLSAGDNITLTKNDQTGVTTIAATGGGGGGASTINVTVEDRNTEQLITAPASSVYFTENGFKGDISNNTANIQWKGIFGLDSNEDLIDYEKGIQWSEDFSVGTSEDHFTVSLTNPIPTNVSDLTNDSGYTTSAVVSAIASAYAEQGGGGGIEYTSITPNLLAVDNVNHTLSAASQGGGGSTNLIAGNRIRLTETAQGTRIDWLEYKVSANNQTFDFDWRNGVETSALVYQYEGDYPIQATFNPVLPNGITFSNGIFTATSGATVTNGTSVISTTIFAEDAMEKTIETTFNTIGFVNAEISASTITSFVFDANNAETISAFTWNVVSGTPQNLTVEISGDLPEGVTSALSIQNRTLTLSATSQSLAGNITKTIQVIFTADNIERTVVTLQLVVQNVVIRTPLTFENVTNSSNVIALSANGTVTSLPVTVKYNKNNTGWEDYTIGNTITLNPNQTVAFSGSPSNIYCASGAYDNSGYKFMSNISEAGRFKIYGNINSLIGYSELTAIACFKNLFNGNRAIVDASNLSLPASSLTVRCYASMFQDCKLLSTAPQLPATTLAEGCYKSMFQSCEALLTPPSILPATELYKQSYSGMFKQCYQLTGIPTLSFTSFNGNHVCANMFESCAKITSVVLNSTSTPASYCYNTMFGGCTSLNYIEVNFSDWGSTDACQNWVWNVATNGTFVKPAALAETYGQNNIPSGWTVVNK